MASCASKVGGAMSGSYTIASARTADLPLLADIELAAARLLVGFAPESILTEATPLVDFERAQADGHLWVARTGNRPVGFAHVKLLENDSAHLDELDVHPDHGRRGLGRRLVGTVCDWAASTGLRTVTLSTFREPPWNMSFYASIGFDVVEREERSSAMRRVVIDETRRGLDPSRRVIMRCVVRGRVGADAGEAQ
jgi:GNAT superfamily N-acetyltransferase